MIIASRGLQPTVFKTIVSCYDASRNVILWALNTNVGTVELSRSTLPDRDSAR